MPTSVRGNMETLSEFVQNFKEMFKYLLLKYFAHLISVLVIFEKFKMRMFCQELFHSLSVRHLDFASTRCRGNGHFFWWSGSREGKGTFVNRFNFLHRKGFVMAYCHYFIKFYGSLVKSFCLA